MDNKEWKLRDEGWEYENERVRIAWRRDMDDKLVDLYEKHEYGKRTGNVDIGFIGRGTRKDGSVFYYVAMGYYSDLIDMTVLNATNYIDALREVMIMWSYLPGECPESDYGYYDYGDIGCIVKHYANGDRPHCLEDLYKLDGIEMPVEESDDDF